MAKLADAQVSGSCGQPCGFESLRPHQKNEISQVGYLIFSLHTNTKGFEGGAANGGERFALRNLDNDIVDGKGGN